MLASAYEARTFGANLTPPADVVCSHTQITSSTTGTTFGPDTDAAGARIAFVSSGNLTGENPDGSAHVFLFDSTTSSLIQVTTAGGAVGPPTTSLAINNAGTRIVFGSTANLAGENADGNAELFLFDTTTGTFTQVTSTTGQSISSSPSINRTGTRIAFSSPQDLTGGNRDGNSEIFLFDTITGTFTQVTSTGSSIFSGIPEMNAAGTRIVFDSNGNLTGENADGNFELFLFDTLSSTFAQITSTTGNSSIPAPIDIDAAGTRIAFTTNGNLTGKNADGNLELFLLDTTTSSLTQVTNTTGNSVSAGPAINAAGTRIAFASSADLTGENADGNLELFLFDTTTSSFTQVTNTTGSSVSTGPAINAVGTRIAFGSSADLTGENPDGTREIFLATCTGIVNDLVTLTPLHSTYQTIADTAGCPAGFVGQFRFAARLTVEPRSPALADLQVQVRTLTNGNLLQNADSGPGGVGATMRVPATGQFSDAILSANEFVDVSFVVCLRQTTPFQFFVDVLGIERPATP